MRSVLLFGLLILSLSGCAESTIGGGNASQNPLYTQDQTVQLENSDRVNRFARLAAVAGTAPPTIDQLTAPAGSAPTVSGPVPVVRVVFKESVFFASGSDVPLPQSAPIFDMIAANMAHDVPDAALTILGHTDAVGTDAYNMDLSKRRALAVMQELATRGVNPGQMFTIAIGFHQPIAPNDTPDGRALNRRVEFLISANPDANAQVVQQDIHIPSSYYYVDDASPILPKMVAKVEICQPVLSSVTPSKAAPSSAPDLTVPAKLAQTPSASPAALKLAPVATLQLSDPSQLQLAPLAPPPLLVERPLSALQPPAVATAATTSN